MSVANYCVFLGTNDPDYGDMPKDWELLEYPSDKLVMAISFFHGISKASGHNPVALVCFPAHGGASLMAYDGALDLSGNGFELERLLRKFVKLRELYEEMAGVGQNLLGDDDE